MDSGSRLWSFEKNKKTKTNLKQVQGCQGRLPGLGWFLGSDWGGFWGQTGVVFGVRLGAGCEVTLGAGCEVRLGWFLGSDWGQVVRSGRGQVVGMGAGCEVRAGGRL